MTVITQLLSVQETLTNRDAKKHIVHPFDVPPGATQLDVRFEFAPLQVEGQMGTNNLSLSLFDPEGPRGAGHSCLDRSSISISAVYATPGYVPGALQPGQWTLVIDTHMVLSGTPVGYRLDVGVLFDPIPGYAPVRTKGVTNPRGTGWYRGDLHAHSIHSDAHWDVPDLVEAARAYGLDFVTLTDHNTIAPLAQMDSLAADDLLTMGGLELTTYYGHALALGVRHWIDWRVRDGERTMQDIAAEVEAAGGLFVIAHPMSEGDPICTGCDWRYDDMLPGSARIVEVWNGGQWADYNERSLALWYSWLNQGHCIVATAGTDAHGPSPAALQPGFNVVYAEALSEAAILQAISLGHLYLSSGPKLKISATTADGACAMMGDLLRGQSAEVTVRWDGAPDESCLRLVADGTPQAEFPAMFTGQQTWQVSPERATWYVAELRDKDGTMLALTNPIFLQLN
jgi:hypothetical protein